jgi:phenylacetate-CoA ligase
MSLISGVPKAMKLSGTAKRMLRPLCNLPMRLWTPNVYFQTMELLEREQYRSADELHDYQFRELRRLLVHCAEHVPYYRKLMRKSGFDPQAMKSSSDLAQLPTLDKEIIRANMADMVADNIPQSQRHYFTTGGTTGKPLGLIASSDHEWHDRAAHEWTWKRVGFTPGEQRAVLRGGVVKSPRHWE